MRLLLLLLLSLRLAGAVDLQGACFRVIHTMKEILYPANLEEIPTAITLRGGGVLEVDRYIASGRPAVVGIVKGKSKNGRTLVAKKVRDTKYNKDLQNEWNFYNENNAAFRGKVIPIYERLQANDGTAILVKPYIEGESLYSLVTSKTLNPWQLRGLQKLFAWTEEHYNRTGVALDINPFNMLWVDEPEALATLGLREPSFVFYEITPAGSKFDAVLYRKLISKIKSYTQPSDSRIEDFPVPEGERETAVAQ